MSPFGLADARFAPPPPPARVAFLRAQPFAHRGLHDVGDRLENSPSAFQAAIVHGYGIECDVQLSRDDEAFVFHDWALDRLTLERGEIGARSAREIAAIRLMNGEPIPRLTELLATVAGRAPLLIEVKSRTRNAVPACLAVRRALEGYRGAVAVMSFNPEVSRWFAAHAPRIVRGLVVTQEEERGLLRGRLRRQLALWRARPDFLAYDVRDLPSPFAEAQRDRGLPVLTWTVRGADPAYDRIAGADQIIFEHLHRTPAGA